MLKFSEYIRESYIFEPGDKVKLRQGSKAYANGTIKHRVGKGKYAVDWGRDFKGKDGHVSNHHVDDLEPQDDMALHLGGGKMNEGEERKHPERFEPGDEVICTAYRAGQNRGVILHRHPADPCAYRVRFPDGYEGVQHQSFFKHVLKHKHKK